LTIDNYLGSGFAGLAGGVVGFDSDSFDSDFVEFFDDPELFSVEDDSDFEAVELVEEPVFL
jgi:hypothetical protein